MYGMIKLTKLFRFFFPPVSLASQNLRESRENKKRKNRPYDTDDQEPLDIFSISF